MRPRALELEACERKELERIRDHDPRPYLRPYLRERAAALLKVAGGMSAFRVAQEGLHKPRHPETILIWLNEYEQTRQLRPRPATRRSFSPSGQGSQSDLEPIAPKSQSLGRGTKPLDSPTPTPTLSLPPDKQRDKDFE